jgi:hypothetical protein
MFQRRASGLAEAMNEAHAFRSRYMSKYVRALAGNPTMSEVTHRRWDFATVSPRRGYPRRRYRVARFQSATAGGRPVPRARQPHSQLRPQLRRATWPLLRDHFGDLRILGDLAPRRPLTRR